MHWLQTEEAEEDPGTGLHRPRDYMKSLEARVAYLEGLLQEARPEVAIDHFAANGESSPSALVPQRPQAENFHSAGGPQGASPGVGEHSDVLSSEVAFLCLSATGSEPHFFGASSAVSFSRIVSAAMGLGRSGSAASDSQPSIRGAGARQRGAHFDTQAAHQVPIRLPTPEMKGILTEAYFSNIHPQYPVIHRPTFRTWEDECWRAVSDGTLDRVADISLFSVLMVYAIGSLVQGQYHYESAEKYHAMALDRVPAILDLDSLESVQALLFCAVYSIRSPVGASLWKLSGMAIRLCIELGYHLDAEKYHRHVDPLTKEMTKRCFWVTYDIDRVAAFTLGRPVGIPEASIDVDLPLDIDDEKVTASGITSSPRREAADPPTSMSGAIHAIRLRRLWTKMNDQLYPPKGRRSCGDVCLQQRIIDSLRKDLDDWHTATPDQLDHSASHPLSVFASKSWFQLAYDYTVLLLYRHYMFASHSGRNGVGVNDSTVVSDMAEAANTALEECFVRARQICLGYRRIYQSSSVQFTWGSVHILFLAGLTYLFCLWHSSALRSKAKQSDVMSTCMACNTVLIIVAERWNLATSYRVAFETLSERTIRMICGDMDDPSNSVPLPFATNEQTFGPHAAAQDAAGTAEPLFQDWIMGLEDIRIPRESEWFVNDLLRDVNAGGFTPSSPNSLAHSSMLRHCTSRTDDLRQILDST
ncbi:hypothetical protein N8I77_013156 [Diaporthe amygdali]|uniref:Xylanolytic transcriptional activator regulatory domain-containing protein n=1 Tax=Phomopsis amygdali TaxID=1214568 RepID=A0AAD9S0Z4_PHOAM|nr:hypothetical protein N8I77_013156 [Diaporthe amygdali]